VRKNSFSKFKSKFKIKNLLRALLGGMLGTSLLREGNPMSKLVLKF
jgi:hypothetical protein